MAYEVPSTVLRLPSWRIRLSVEDLRRARDAGWRRVGPWVGPWIERLRPWIGRSVAAARELRHRPVGRWPKIAGLVAGGLTVLLMIDVLAGTPSPSEIRGLAQMPLATIVFDRHDRPAFTVFEERRFDVTLDRVSPHMVQAVLAIEDQRFYDHYGIDPWRIGGAALANLRSIEWAQGGSTITQQLARLSFLTREKSLRRKAKEAFLALRIERQFTKDQILELYLNKVYLGAGLYGVEAAARGYFGKPAADLAPAEAALLAGLIQAPSAYAPTSHLDRAVARRGVVLEQMAQAGFLDEVEAASLARSPVTLVDGFEHERVGAYFKQAVTRELVDRFGWDLVAKGGLRVYTTFDPAAQAAAEAAVASGLDAIERRAGFRHPTRGEPAAGGAEGAPGYLQGALVALDPTTGEVRALVGGRDYDESQFDRVTQAWRQPGSAFKPFVYAAALEMGYTPATLITGLDEPMDTPEGAWVPEDGHSDASAMTVRAALRTSSNRAAVQVLRAVGIPRAVTYSGRLGVLAPPVPSLVLGSGDVTLLSMTTAYGAFANGGWRRSPVLVRRVEDADGAVLLTAEPESERVVSEETAFIMAQLLADVLDRGTGYAARQAGFRLPAAGKTGTTNEYKDAWFVGFTPDLVAGVWVGFDQPQRIMANGYASQLAAPIWGRFMRAATGSASNDWIERPDDVVAVEICRESGLLPGAGCSRVARVDETGATGWKSAIGVEYFQRGTVPEERCPIHGWTSFVGSFRALAEGHPDLPARSAIPSLSVIGPGDPIAALARPGRTADTGPADADQAGTEEKVEGEKKKGFWSRFLGVFKGGDKDAKKKKTGGGGEP
jgi:penicillin-binding protein 1A